MSVEAPLLLRIPRLDRVEAHAGVEISLVEGKVERVALQIQESPRFLEKLMEGFGYEAAVEMASRVRASGSVSHQLCAVEALEDLFRVDPGPEIGALRRVMHCGEWLRSHSRHIHWMAALDFLDVDGFAALAQRYPDVVRRGLRLQALGRDLVALLGGRSVHPVSLCVGGFHRLPAPPPVERMCRRLEATLADAAALARWCAGLELPAQRQVFTSVGLSHHRDYAMGSGQIISGSGGHLHIRELAGHLSLRQVPHSSLLQCCLDGQTYLVGPLARVNLNLHQLPKPVLDNLDGCGIRFPSHNMFHSIVARAVEAHFAVFEALRLLSDYRPPAVTRILAEPCGGTAVGCVESPAGMIWTRFELDPGGRVESARILCASGQNQARVEDDLASAPAGYAPERNDRELRDWCARAVRNYDL